MKKIAFFIVLITSVFIIQSLITSIYYLWQKHDLVTKAEKELEKHKKENQKIKKELKYVKSSDFVEKEARDKLFLLKPGESKVIIDEAILQAVRDKKENKAKEDIRTNIEKWWDLFF